METYGFRDWYNEGMWDWAKRAGHAALNWSPANPQTMGTYPSKYVDAQGKEIPDAPDSAMQSPMAQPRRAARALPGGYGPTTQPQKKTIGFRINDMNKLHAAVTDYLGLISRFIEKLHATNPYISFTKNSIDEFEKNVGPPYEKLYSKVKWINDMNTLARAQKNESVEVFLEVVKVGFKRFEEMVAAIKELAGALRIWVYNTARRLPQGHAQELMNAYQKNIVSHQTNLATQVQWLRSKIQELMQMHNIPYKAF
jgi:hypothetical protein